MVPSRSSGTRRRTGCTPRREFSLGVLDSRHSGRALRASRNDRSPGNLLKPSPEHSTLPLSANTAPDDVVQPFRIDPFALRGRLVRLGPTIDRILSQHDYPEPVATMLGEAITLAVVLAGALKYDGIFTLQTKGDGPIRMMVADVSTEGAVRGYAQYDR